MISIHKVLAVSFIMVTLDLFTTWCGLSIGLYEQNRLGGIPLLEYSVCIGATCLFYAYEKHYNMKHVISLLYALFPIVAVFNNLFFILLVLW